MNSIPKRAETRPRRPSLKHRVLAQIGWHVLAGMTVEDATVKAATDVKTQALSKGWPEPSATAIALFVVTAGAQWAADLAAAKARR